MDELEISGRRYISSVRAAKEYKYHSDYIGQLVRGGKVAGQKVGRAWYVDADSLSEYLGKEPTPTKTKTKRDAGGSEPTKEKIEVLVNEEETEGAGDRPVAEPKTDVRGLSSAPQQNENFEETIEPTFIMPLRKSGRSHVIAAIGDAPVTKEPEKIIEPVVEVVPEEIQEEPAEVFTTDEKEEEETYIPVKITKPTPQIYAEPEDSFYKVSRKGIRYVSQDAPRRAATAKASPLQKTAPVRAKATAAKIAGAISVVLVAGVLSLGAGILMSYYLHSQTTIAGAGQTSSVLLSK